MKLHKPSAQRAIEILTAMAAELDPASLAYWVAPNVVLTLSGARAYADGVFWDERQQGLLTTWQKEIEQSLEVLKKIVPLQWSEVAITEARPGEQFAGFELLTREGLQRVLHSTKLLPGLSAQDIDDTLSVLKIQGLMMANLRQQPQFAALPKEDVQHITFGVMVGYPDQAILQSILRPRGTQEGHEEPEVAANIRMADYYDCPQPVYSYPKSLANDPVIQEHERLWSRILADYYTSDFHTQLAQNNSFKAKVRELGMQK